jgi:dTDP-4-dehydrorhamnose 3,5-epimerase-like enzyme
MSTQKQIEKCRLINLPTIADPRGNLTVIEEREDISFEIKRIFYLYDVPKTATRGGHGHRQLEQFIIAMCGSFDIVLDDGYTEKEFTLSSPYEGLYICPMVWGKIDNFSSGAVCLVLASAPYDESDYYRDYGVFLQAVRGGV